MFLTNVGECNTLLRSVPTEAMPGNKRFTIFAIISNNIVIRHADITFVAHVAEYHYKLSALIEKE